MRTSLDLPDPVLRHLKIQAAQSGKSLKALLNELILRALAISASSNQHVPAVLPVLSRLGHAGFNPGSAADGLNEANLHLSQTDAELQDDLDKLRRSGFIQ